jgi:hypothetical protein
MSDMNSPTSQVAALISRGKEQGYLTYAEVNDHLPDSITESEQIEDYSNASRRRYSCMNARMMMMHVW